MTGTASLGLRTLTTMGVGAMMVIAGLGKRRLYRRPLPRTPRLNPFRRRR